MIYRKEAEIDELYSKKTNLTNDDIIKFLLWKTGGSCKENVITTQYGGHICVDEVEKIVDDLDESSRSKSVEELYCQIVKKV